MSAPDVNDWIAEVKAGPEAAEIGMMLAHHAIVRGATRAGEAVCGMTVSADGVRLEEVLEEATTWPGVVAVRAWVNEGSLCVGDDIMKALVAGDIRDNVFGGLQRLMTLIRNEVMTKVEAPEPH